MALSIAVVGTTVGLSTGNYYQHKASIERDITDRQGTLLSDLQVAMLQTLPTKEFFPLLEEPIKFQQHKSELPRRVAEIKTLISELRSSAQTSTTNDLNALLKKGDRAAEKFYQNLEVVLNQAQPLMLEPESAGAAKKLIGDFTGGEEFAVITNYAYELTPFIKTARYQEQQAQIALFKAETLRTEIVAASMLLSVLIAAFLAWKTSRAIARPIEAVTQVAQRVSLESNFALQVPVTTEDEVSLLATAFNKLIQRVEAHTQELSQKNQQLQQTSNELQDTIKTLQRAQSQLVQTEKMSSLGQLVAGVAHEINNPVNFINGNLTYAGEYAQEFVHLLKLYQQYYPNPVSEIQERAEAIDLEFMLKDFPKLLASMKIGADRIRNIVLSLRNFSHLDQADMKEVNVHEGIDSTLLILQNRLKAKHDYPGIQVIKEYGKMPLVECYAGQLNQVFMNILTNAIEAIEEFNKKRSIEDINSHAPTIKICTELLNSQRVMIRIIDNGNGMTEEISSHLFDPFFTTKPVGLGTGLGMSISYSIVVEKHKGQIQCISAPGQGAEFLIQIPIRQVSSQVGTHQEALV